MFANTNKEKDDLVAQFNGETDLLLWGWVGQWRTDIFFLSIADLNEYYR